MFIPSKQMQDCHLPASKGLKADIRYATLQQDDRKSAAASSFRGHDGDDLPAGMRIAKPFQKALEDKVPRWKEKILNAGAADHELQGFMEDKMKLESHKWDHRNLVGAKVARKNQKINATKPAQTKEVFVNPATGREIAKNKHARMMSLPSITNRRQMMAAKSQMEADLIQARHSKLLRGSQGHETFCTTNQNFYAVNEPVDFSPYKKNFKKKTPLTQWSNAYFSGGVHFNPPVSGI